jgi:superfamily II DNA or RNA helicase
MDTSRNDLTEDFFKPLLAASCRYDRGVGFFSSAWLRVNASGMVAFAANGGHARWITSPILAPKDWKAMLEGTEARRSRVLHQALERHITDLARAIETHTLSALAWMIADTILDFRLAVPANDLTGEFHAKFGVFADADGNRLSFEGSYNDSIQGTRNYESLKIFCSWKPHQDEMVQHDRERFERLWCDEDPNVQVYALPEAARQQILQLRTHERPYPTHQRIAERPEPYQVQPIPRRPTVLRLRDYQEAALQAWFDNGCRGILEMATGTGKTITSLAAMVRLFGRERRLAIIISCPYQYLVDQWQREVAAFGLQPLLAYQSKTHWRTPFNQQVSEYIHGDRSHIAVITTHTTFTDTDFQRILGRINGPPALLIADEVHHLGAARSRTRLPHLVPYRLGLSATPDRWFDDAGTDALRDYFGETVFEYPLEQAIGTALTPYSYYPQLVELTTDEMDEYQSLSEQIGKLMDRDEPEKQAALEMLLIKRARLLNRAENKLTCLHRLLSELGPLSHALFYCAPEQIDAVCRLVGWDHGLLIHTFTAEENNDERQRLLADFAAGHLQGLVAMKCLDEGVDVPGTRIAFILASSSNPREFIQRRGRILRRAEGKEEAVIYDLIAIPPQNWKGAVSFSVEQSIMRHEIARFREFAQCARNKHRAIEVIWDIAQRYEIHEV